ncbi:MAG: VWA domain-containing protein [Cytophagales bacterium]|nr:VWA domain-containing protein [Bernardetiaceae bacterium]MDW8204720.1 VWA domain-containing protein [Cytophagales bacterium]
MMTAYELEQEFNNFIEFGNVFDKAIRTFLVHYIHARLSGTPISNYRLQSLLQNQQSKYFDYLQISLDKILGFSLIREVCEGHPQLTRQIIEDVLKWMREADKKIAAKNPYQQENDMFEAWSHKPTHLWVNSWYVLINFLASTYTREELDKDFYAAKFKALLADPAILQLTTPANGQHSFPEEKSPLDVLIDDLLAQWNALLTAKNLQYYMEEMDKAREEFTTLLHKKVEEFHKLMTLINPFAMEISNFWDMSRSLWKDKGFNVLDHYQQLLANEKAIQELTDLLGRMREAQTEVEEEIFREVIVHKEPQINWQLKSEIGGIHGSNNLSHVLPSEWALLGNPLTEPLFLQKYADRSLMSYRFQGHQWVHSDKVSFTTHRREKRKEKGPFILCIDTSGSMDGLPSQIAKVLCFAIMKMAAKEHRKCYLISFSIGIKTINLLNIAESIDKIVDFLSMSFDGGTDITPALSEALNMLQTADYKDADVMMVSDFVMFDIREDLLHRIRKEQARGTKFHSLTLSSKPNLQVVAQFDNYWVYDPQERNIMRRLWNDIRQLQ